MYHSSHRSYTILGSGNPTSSLTCSCNTWNIELAATTGLASSKLGSFFLVLFLWLLSVFLEDFYRITLFSPYAFLYTILIFPLITISLTIFFITYLNNKPLINRGFKVLGNHSYEVFLIHLIPITLLSLLEIELELYYLYLLIAVFGSIALSHPFIMWDI